MAATVTASANVDNGSTSGTTITVSVTIASGDNCVVFTAGGYDPTSRLSATATINGSAMTRLEENYNSTGGPVTGQHSTIFVMYSDDANWPGTGTFSCVATFTGNLQQKGAVAALAGVDVGGTPSAGSTSGNNATASRDTTVSLTVGSETIDQAFNGNGVSWSGSSVVLNGATGDGIQLMYINTYSNSNSGAGTGDTIHESTSNGGSSSSLILLSRVVSAGGSTRNRMIVTG